MQRAHMQVHYRPGVIVKRETTQKRSETKQAETKRSETRHNRNETR